MIPTFSEQINQWAENLPTKAVGGRSRPDGSFVQGPEETCKLLAFRLIAMSIYGEAFDEAVCISPYWTLVTHRKKTRIG